MNNIDRQHIEQHHMVERYLAERLSGDELAQFEEHLLWCDETRREVELAENLAMGLRSLLPHYTSKPRWQGQLLSVAAAAILGAGITLLIVEPSVPDPVGVAATNVLYLEPTRSAGNLPTLEAATGPGWTTLVVYPDFADFEHIRVILERSSSPAPQPAEGNGWQEIWRVDVDPGNRDSLALSVDRALLSEGIYRVRTQGRRGEDYHPAGDAMFRAGK
jgi:hypothetical protein